MLSIAKINAPFKVEYPRQFVWILPGSGEHGLIVACNEGLKDMGTNHPAVIGNPGMRIVGIRIGGGHHVDRPGG